MASPSSDSLFNHDVFISFRGEDTRKTFVSHLNKALEYNRGIRTFIDSRKLEVGNSIPEELSKAIHSSRFAIVVLSEKYVTSSWCLDELHLIMELVEKKKTEVFPIFYGVNPSDVRHQRGNFSLERYQSSEKAEKVPGWRKALSDVADRTGKESTQCVDDATMIEEVVQSISSRLFSMFPIQFHDIVGMEAHMEDLNPLLAMDSKDEVRVIGIWGMGGIGKTTIAKYLYEKHKFGFSPHHYFMEDVAELSRGHGLVHLQRQIFSNLFREQNMMLESIEHGRHQLKYRLRNVKVLLVLDDVDDREQLCALAKEVRWFRPGSRIIITTRDKSLLNSLGVEFVYNVKFLDDDQALQLFQRIAFEGDQHPTDYEDLPNSVSRLAQGLPLALEALATSLRGKSKWEWHKALRLFEEATSMNINRILNISCDSLDELSKTAFLHVACLFNGNPVSHVQTLLDRGEFGIKVLVEKSLIDISADGRIAMHQMLELKGRNIVLGYYPGQRRISWHWKDIRQALSDKAGTINTEGVALDVSKMPNDFHIKREHFKQMENLNFLKIYNYNPSESLACWRRSNLKRLLLLPHKLRSLHWDAYPFKTLPSSINPDFLVEVNLCYSELRTLWSGAPPRLSHLRRLNLTGSKHLKKLPHLEEAVYLEELMLEGCISLKRIPKSICSLTRLQKLDVSNCNGLKNLRILIGASEASLFEGRSFYVKSVCLDFHDAQPSVQESRPISLSNLSIKGNLEIELKLLGGHAEHLCVISEQQIPHQLMMLEQQTARAMSPLYGFRSLDIMRFNYSEENDPFKCYSFSELPWLMDLNLINLNIEEIPDNIDHMQLLEKLDLSGNDFRVLPSTMMHLSKLKHVTLCNCRRLEALPELYQVETLTLSDCTNLRALVNLPQEEQGQGSYSLLELRLDNCKNVESLSHELSHFTKLTYLDLSRHDFETVPTSIKDLSSLVTLCLNYCQNLKSLTELPLNLKYLYSHGCESLEAFSLSIDHSIDHLDLGTSSSQITPFPAERRSEEEMMGNSYRMIVLPGFTDKLMPLCL